MKKIDVSNVLSLHSLLKEYTQGGIGIRDNSLLESAVFGIYQTFGGKELYPTIIEKAVHLCFSLVKNHPFIDGNKRIGVLSMLVLLSVNRVEYNFSNEDIVKIGTEVASGKMESNDLFSFVSKHIVFSF